MTPSEPVFDRNADDLTLRPWEYPGRPPTHSGLLHDDAFVPLAMPPAGDWGAARVGGDDEQAPRLDGLLRAAGVAGVAERALVLAVGSNASPAVMRRKFAPRGVSATLPFLAVRVGGFRVGHSAHVSITGFIAAAGGRATGSETLSWASLLDEEQLHCLDETEPNYVRRRLDPSDCPAVLDGGAAAPELHTYDSRWGLIAPPGRLPLPLLPQDELVALLLRDCPPFCGLVDGSRGTREAMARLRADASTRERVRDAFAAQGWTVPSGLA